MQSKMKPSLFVSHLFWKKIKQELRLEGIIEKKPKKQISLAPIDHDDLNLNVPKILEWSENNQSLHELIKKHGFATFICNKQFLYEHYKTLTFIKNNLTQIDQDTKRFVNLQYLNLSLNSITVLENIPISVIELQISSNLIKQINIKQNKLQYLNISSNRLRDSSLEIIKTYFGELRHLDIGYNQIIGIENVFVLKRLEYLKSLVLQGNPISLLAHYYSTVTGQMSLSYFDGAKYVKQEKKPAVVKQVENIISVDKKEKEKEKQKKDTKKEIKKDTKKDNKKQLEPEPVLVAPVVEQKKILNINESIFKLQINILSSINPPTLEPQNCPNYEENPKQYLPSYWIQYRKPAQNIISKSQKISFDSAVVEQNKGRINLSEVVKHTFEPNVQFRDYISKGIIIKLYKQQPKTTIDLNTGEKKPQMNGNLVVKEEKCQGIMFLNMQQLFASKSKTIEYQYKLFPLESQKQAELLYPYQNQAELIQKNKARLDRIKQNRQKEKQKQKEALLELAKKQGKKEVKKMEKKPVAKKGDKVEEEKKVDASSYPKYPRNYVYVSDDRIIEACEYEMAVSVSIEN